MRVLIEDKAFELKFGFKCLITLGKNLGFKTFNETVNHLSILDNMGNDVSFDQADLITALIEAAAESHPSYYQLEYSIQDVSIMDWVITNPVEFGEVVKELVASLPQDTTKKKTAAKKQPAKKN